MAATSVQRLVERFSTIRSEFAEAKAKARFSAGMRSAFVGIEAKASAIFASLGNYQSETPAVSALAVNIGKLLTEIREELSATETKTTSVFGMMTSKGLSVQTQESATCKFAFTKSEAHEVHADFSEAHSLIAHIHATDVNVQKHLKIVLHALLVDSPMITTRYKLAITAKAVQVIIGIQPVVWDEKVLEAVRECLADVPLEYPSFDVPPLEGFAEEHARMQEALKKAPDFLVNELRKDLRSLILAAPALTHSALLDFANQALRKINKDVSWVTWSEEDPVYQLTRLLYFTYIPIEETDPMPEVSSSSSSETLPLPRVKAVLYAIGEGIVGLTDEQRIYAAKCAIKEMTGFECTTEQLVSIYEGLGSVPLEIVDFDIPSYEGFEAMYDVVKASFLGLSLEAQNELKNNLYHLLVAAGVIPAEKYILSLANLALNKQGISSPTWTEENPVEQVMRYLYFCHCC